MQIKQIDPRALTPYGKNTKKHDQTQIDNVAESIRQFGFVQPVVVDKENTIVIGHCRVLASIQLGMDTVPCVAVDDLTPEQVQALRIVDNKTNESPWDFAMLELELSEISLDGFYFGDFGVIQDEIEAEKKEEEEIEKNKVDKLPESRVLGFSVSLFGTSSECFVEIKIDSEDAERLLRKINENGVSDIVSKMRKVIADV